MGWIKEDKEYVATELERLQKTCLKAILEYKKLKSIQYVGSEKLFYQHLAENILESKAFGLSLDRIDGETFLALEALCLKLTLREDLVHYTGY